MVHDTIESPSWLKDSDTGFAWQAIAEIRAPLSDNWDVGLKYRFFNVDKTRFQLPSGAEASGRFRSHSLLASLIYNVGEPAALKRQDLGVWVLLFLVLLTFLAYLLKQEYWKDVH